MTNEKLQGVVARLTFVNPTNGYFVAVVEVPGVGERTVKGTAPFINVGETLTAKGGWERSQWGPQFKAVDVRLAPPRLLHHIEKYLCSAVDGIGPGFAKKLVDAFGEQVFDVIENAPEKLRTVKGVGKKRVESVVAAYKENKAVRDIMLFLHRFGLGTGRAQRVYKTLGPKAIEKIEKNPYVLCKEVRGIGFLIADDFARKQGVAAESEYRVRAGIQHILSESEQRGSCGVQMDSERDAEGKVKRRRDGSIRNPGLLDAATELLGVSTELVETCLGYELEAKELHKGLDGEGGLCVFSNTVFEAEQEISNRLLQALARPLQTPFADIDGSILEAEIDIGLILEDSQREALRLALSSPVCVITGGPGCGKTTITNLLLRVFQEHSLTTVLAAPTGKAAKRAAEATGHDAATVHRTYKLGRDGHFEVNENNPLDADVLTLDETSMLDVYLTRSVLRGISPRTRLILIGDVDQLPSVGAGKVLHDIIASGAVPVARLTTVFRQAANSAIIRNAHRINKGLLPDLGYYENSDFAFFNFQPNDRTDEDEKRSVRKSMRDELVRLARDMYKRGYDPIKEVQVYSPMRKGVLGVEELNIALQSALNPKPAAQLEVNGVRWGQGDKVMQLKNNSIKGVFNGNVGFIVGIDATERTVTVEFEEQAVRYKSSEFDELVLAYAITIHKSQGSESPVVLIPVDYSHFTMLKRNLLYTGVTRAKKLCILLGDREAVKLAVENNQNDDRHSRLKRLLAGGVIVPLEESPA